MKIRHKNLIFKIKKTSKMWIRYLRKHNNFIWIKNTNNPKYCAYNVLNFSRSILEKLVYNMHKLYIS
jgi:hypothetical protein